MLKVCSLAALALLGTATLVAAQGPDQRKQGDGAPQRASPPQPRAAPPPQRPAARAPQAPPERPAARAPQAPPAAATRANEAQARRAAEQQRAAEQRRAAGQRALEQRRAAEQQQRANESRQAAERQRAAERQAAEQRRATEQLRANERKQQADRQRALERQGAERQRAAEQQRAVEQRRAAERANPALRPGANQPITARHEQLRQERAKLSRNEHIRLRQAFTINRERITRVHFTRRVGTRIPRSVRLFAVPAAVLAIFPYYRDYRYVVEEDTICIVDPDTYEIVDVLDEGTYAPSPRPQLAELTLTDRERAIVLDSIPPNFPRWGCGFVWLWAPKSHLASTSTISPRSSSIKCQNCAISGLSSRKIKS